jgi:hypothetical protein
MIADPLTISSNTFAFSGNYPLANVADVQSKAVNTLQQNGRSTTRQFSASDLATLQLVKGKVTISHTDTKDGRTRSVLRVDASKLDAALAEHSTGCYLVIDRAASPTGDDNTAIAKALATLFLLCVSGTGAGALSTTSTFTEFLNGEP